MADETRPDFSGKVVKILLPGADPKWQWWSLDAPVVQSQHGRLFLVGQLTRPEPGRPHWGDRVTACIPWDALVVYTVEAIEDRLSRKLGGPEVNTAPNLG